MLSLLPNFHVLQEKSIGFYYIARAYVLLITFQLMRRLENWNKNNAFLVQSNF
jgi:hypothetical protein